MIDSMLYYKLVTLISRARDESAIPDLPVHVRDQLEGALESMEVARKLLPILMHGKLQELDPKSPKGVKQAALMLAFVIGAKNKCPHWQGVTPLFLLPAAGRMWCQSCTPRYDEMMRVELELQQDGTCDICGEEQPDRFLYPSALFSGNVVTSIFICAKHRKWLDSNKLGDI